MTAVTRTSTGGVQINPSTISASSSTSAALGSSPTASHYPGYVSKNAKIGVGFGVVIGLGLLVLIGVLSTILRRRRHPGEEVKGRTYNPYCTDEEPYQRPAETDEEKSVRVDPVVNGLAGGSDGSQELHGDSMSIKELP